MNIFLPYKSNKFSSLFAVDFFNHIRNSSSYKLFYASIKLRNFVILKESRAKGDKEFRQSAVIASEAWQSRTEHHLLGVNYRNLYQIIHD
jgi:hypothetical protein